ncbi:MAG TPA: sigma-70 family RNA polymerase sigma factor, partial [Pyrinomonadaceae bacterium]|nr:sigma-70 family RNA polymerase sigma factor [Pyrinomonadaceae bacterium]
MSAISPTNELLFSVAGAGASVRDEEPACEMTDHRLLEATRTGDEVAFAELVRRYRNQITNYVYRMTNDYELAVDLAQETFMRVYAAAERYQTSYAFSTYIYRIATNLAISELRRRKRRRLVSLSSFFRERESPSDSTELEMPDA